MNFFCREVQMFQRLLAGSARHCLPGPVPRNVCDRLARSSVFATPCHARFTSTNAEVMKKVTSDMDERNVEQSKLFAVVHISGRQFKVTQNDLIVVNQIEADVGEKIFLEKVLLAGSEDFTVIGRPILSNDFIRITATVTEHNKLAKVIIFKKKRRKNYKRKKGKKFAQAKAG